MVERVECVLGVMYKVLERSLVGFIYLFLCSFAFLIRCISVWCEAAGCVYVFTLMRTSAEREHAAAV